MERDAILVVDDDEKTRERMVDLLRSARHAAENASSILAALSYLRSRPDFGLVLGSMEIDETDGRSLLEAVHHAHPHVPVILMSSRQDVLAVTEAFRRGAADILLKPVDRATLLEAVERAQEQSRQQRQTLLYRQNLEALVAKRTAKLRATMSDLELSYDVTIEAMGDALDLRDEETEGHSKRVTAYTIALGKAMRLSPVELKVIARGAFLHDIGKIAIPDSILLKPGKLTAEEMAIMRSHCDRGYEIVRKIPFLTGASEIVHSHQERFDGSGYPRGLQGQEILLGARIFTIADTLDAITSDRPYRKASSFAEAQAEITRCSGQQFDPEIVEVFLSMSDATWPTIRREVGRHSHASELVRLAVAA